MLLLSSLCTHGLWLIGCATTFVALLVLLRCSEERCSEERCFCACPRSEQCWLSRIRAPSSYIDPDVVANGVFGPPLTGLSAKVFIDMSQPYSSGLASILWGGVAVTTLAIEWVAGASGTDQLVVYQNSAEDFTPRGASTLTVALAEDFEAAGGKNCDKMQVWLPRILSQFIGRDNTPDSQLRQAVVGGGSRAVLAGSIGLNADATAAVLSALQDRFVEMGLSHVITSGCSVDGKLALRTAWASEVVTAVMAVNSGAGGAATDRVCGACGETTPMLGNPSRWANWLSQDPYIDWATRNGAMELILARLLDRGKVIYLVSSTLDSWSNPLGTWASFQAAPRYANTSWLATDAPSTSHPNLRIMFLKSNNHCGFYEPFDLGSFSTTAPCPMGALDCDRVEEWLQSARRDTQPI
jgi:hypothetical protein